MKTKRLMMIAVIFGMAMSVSAQEVSESKVWNRQRGLRDQSVHLW